MAQTSKKLIRLDKYLANMGVGSRSQVKTMARKKQIQVNGVVITQSDSKVDPDSDEVTVNGQSIGYAAMEYYMLNKPKGVVSATRDSKIETVLDLIVDKQRSDLFPVGRLDRDTEGLLLITNDGDLSHRLLSPKKHVDKVYYAKVTGAVDEKTIAAFSEGLDIGDDKKTLPAGLTIISSGAESEVKVAIHEGRYHQVKRMFEAVDSEVLYLKRLSMGSLELDPQLQPGEYRALTALELERLNDTNVKE